MIPRLHSVPALYCEQPIPAGAVFFFGYRPLKVVRVCGDDPAAPVICEELEWHNPSRPGQYSLWSLDGILRALNAQVVDNVVPLRRRA